LPASSGPVPSLTVFPNGSVAWYDGTPVRARELADPDVTAALVLLAVAREAAASVTGVPVGSVEVTGTGLIANQVRALVGTASTWRAGHPSAVVDTTGDPAVIVDATRRVADLGIVVLAGEALGRKAEMNLYEDVHVRGLTLVGVAPPLQDGVLRLAENSADNTLVESCRKSLAHVGPDSPLPSDSTWYRVSG
jgi:hypothetical protein